MGIGRMLEAMGWLMDLIKNLPLCAVLREKIATLVQEKAALVGEREVLSAKCAHLQAENEILKNQSAELGQEIQRLKDEATERFRVVGPRRFGSPRDRNPYRDFP